MTNGTYNCVLKRLSDTRYLKCAIIEGTVFFYVEIRQSDRVKALRPFRYPTSVILSYASEPEICKIVEEAFNDPVFQLFRLVWGVPQ